jgi:Fanconi anemia group M protein
MLTPEAPGGREELAQKVAEVKGQKSLGEFPKDKASAAATADGDIEVSPRVGVAVRTVDEFVAQANDGSLAKALKGLRAAYARPVLIVQGEAEGKGSTRINSAAYDFLGAMLAGFDLTVLSTADASQTQAAVASLREQEQAKERAAKGRQTTFDPSGKQMFVLQGLPNVSATIAERLLRHFGSVDGIERATAEELAGAEGIGRVIAEGIHTALRKRCEEV